MLCLLQSFTAKNRIFLFFLRVHSPRPGYDYGILLNFFYPATLEQAKDEWKIFQFFYSFYLFYLGKKKILAQLSQRVHLYLLRFWNLYYLPCTRSSTVLHALLYVSGKFLAPPPPHILPRKSIPHFSSQKWFVMLPQELLTQSWYIKRYFLQREIWVG